MEGQTKGLLIILSGPSGVGKGTICRELFRQYRDIDYSVSATTRNARPGEVDGKDYFFYSQEEFEKRIQDTDFLEWARVYDHYYGTPMSYVEQMRAQGKDVILEIDIQGALQVKEKKPEGIFVFIAPPSKEELLRRITSRGTEKPEEIAKRMSCVDDELRQLTDYDYVVVNDVLSQAVEKVRAVIVAERCRVRKNTD